MSCFCEFEYKTWRIIMIYIKAHGSDLTFFEDLEKKYEDILVSDSKNFDGSAELVEVFITLSPVILSSLTVIITQILSYMKAKHNDDAKKEGEIQIELKRPSGEFKIIIKSPDIDNLDEATKM